MKRIASAAWAGGLKDGTGTISVDSGVLSNTRYRYQSRFEEASGTNPEELVAAALAGCFSMSLAAQLEDAGTKAESIRTTATLSLERISDVYSVTAIRLDTVADVPGMTQAAFENAVAHAEAVCPISKLLRAKITLTAKLED